MARASVHPYGCRIRAGSQIKLRMVNLIHTYNGTYADMWNAGWTTSYMTAQINAAVSVGANSVKLFCSGLSEYACDGGSVGIGGTAPSDAVLRSRLQWTFQQLRNAGLKMYFSVGPIPGDLFGDNQAATITANLKVTQKIIQWVIADAPDLLVAFELCNEINENLPSAWTDGSTNSHVLGSQQRAAVTQLVQAARAAAAQMGVYVPMSFSVFLDDKNLLATSPHIGLQKSLGMDFHDYHPYWQLFPYYPNGQIPDATDLNILRSRSDYIGTHFMGENGCGLAWYDGTVTPAAFRTNWINRLGDHCRDRDSVGGNFFVICDYHDQDTDNFGMFDKNLANPRLPTITPFRSWPANL